MCVFLFWQIVFTAVVYRMILHIRKERYIYMHIKAKNFFLLFLPKRDKINILKLKILCFGVFDDEFYLIYI